MATPKAGPDEVLVEGPNGRHIPVHKDIQAALPEAFPLAKTSAPAKKSTSTSRKSAAAEKKPALAATDDAPASTVTVDDTEGA